MSKFDLFLKFVEMIATEAQQFRIALAVVTGDRLAVANAMSPAPSYVLNEALKFPEQFIPDNAYEAAHAYVSWHDRPRGEYPQWMQDGHKFKDEEASRARAEQS